MAGGKYNLQNEVKSDHLSLSDLCCDLAFIGMANAYEQSISNEDEAEVYSLKLECQKECCPQHESHMN